MSAIPVSRHLVARPDVAAKVMYLITEDFTLPIPVHLTFGQFRQWALSEDWPEHLPVHFVEEEIFLDMTNEELETHNGVKTEVLIVLGSLNKKSKAGKIYGDGSLVSNPKGPVSNNPDAFFLTWETIRTKKARLVPRKQVKDHYIEVEGSPDWVLEVISQSSVNKDKVKLRRAYHRGEVREYWLVDARGADIEFTILLWRKRGYVSAPIVDGWQFSEVFGQWFRLSRQRDQVGMWEYTLEMKAG